MLLIGALIFGATTDSGRRARPAIFKLTNKDAIARLAGFGIDQVSLTGHRFTPDDDVFDALDLSNARSAASFDAEAVKTRIERLPWVATADITRVLPNRLEVRISERQPFAVWARGAHHYLIDETGRVLSAVAPGSQEDLARVSGEGAASEARAVISLLRRHPKLARRLIEVERVAERRWSLKLSGGVIVLLPADREASALDMITSQPALASLVAGKNCIIDLRTPGRVAVRNTAAAASPGATERDCA